jgi:hypothetical protein
MAVFHGVGVAPLAKEYILYLDESGSPRGVLAGAQRSDGMDCFAMGGVLVERTHEIDVVMMHRAFLDRWSISSPLHSSSIRGARKAYAWLGRDAARRAAFLSDLDAFLCGLPVFGVAAVVDRPARWQRAENVAIAHVVRRVAAMLGATGAITEVRFERAGRAEDERLMKLFREMKSWPVAMENFASRTTIGAVVLGDPEGRTKSDPLAQVADLYLYPMAKACYDPMYRAVASLTGARRIGAWTDDRSGIVFVG